MTQRGNRRADVIADDEDRCPFLRFIMEYAGLHGLAVWAYCLMINHVHLVVVRTREDSLSTALKLRLVYGTAVAPTYGAKD